MAVTIPFGTLNTTTAKLITRNAPKGVDRWVEPFGDNGTVALYLEKKKPKAHLLNIEDEILFSMFTFVQSASSSQLKQLKGFDWIGSPETFDSVLAISATEGPEAFYRFLYLKHFTMRVLGADPEATPLFDFSKFGEDASGKLLGLPLMRVGLKKVTIVNGEPSSVMGESGFLILLPSGAEQVETVKTGLSGISSPHMFIAKGEFPVAVEDARQMPNKNVTTFAAATIMMATMEVVWNYDSKLEPLPEEVLAISEA